MKSKEEQKKIGAFIKSLREQRGMTQQELALALRTSQSAVARMETGRQNLSTQALAHIGRVLGRKIVALTNSIDFQIEGGRKLHGTVTTNASKNGALGLLAASVLNDSKTTLHGIPRIEEVHRFIEILTSIGFSIEWVGKNSVVITPPRRVRVKTCNRASAEKIRSTLILLGGLIHRVKLFQIPHAGGCKMGERTIAAHRYGLEKFGVHITTRENRYAVTVGKLKPADVVLYETSDTATENLLIAAARIPGVTRISFASSNYQVQEVCFFLEKLGVMIEGVGTSTLTVHGIPSINMPVEYYNSEDPIESMMFLSAAIVTGSRLTVARCPIYFLQLELLRLEKMGLRYQAGTPYLSYNRKTRLADVTVFPSQLRAPSDKILAQPYPGINTDNLPFFVPIATQAAGTTLIHDWMWENRAIYFTELNRLGAKVTLADPHRVFVEGSTPLKAAQVVCPPALRPAMIILIAMLAAKGTSVLRNVYSINRGYEEVAERLNAIGAKIEIVRGM
ncbi:UDP-N-acetylglucosamine 1-carboxyvinyltransferase [Candidatus Jorgensenbacteria bacterium CG10_big_fil_rev_8_21_14_0_10_54_38]|uniref:UDP-N-acetylglucosamine 1-carboxyvinyltransferase n=1 Tax=Candidatus Jorgensenbacteria bacterium CG10_big_fil_rev_8_21_14_0_10_54_38 TaxID=1974593 RepID=A0A2M6WFW2_9BACT|nr:MAG: UDP-N-acetylglucosamine 1-carboxyvinyltransferase [Candidatus Jorgensenbacteria bacterium CG10_big_fil_rev_8_21_14_0_10_54_38]